jgi:hypothetical protein
MVGGALEVAMTAIWQASLDLLRTAFVLADQFSVFSVSISAGPLKAVWPMMLWISGVLAVGLASSTCRVSGRRWTCGTWV